MRRMFVLSIAVLALGFSAGNAQGEKPGPAKKIIDAALQQASISHKNVLVIFHASWCVWCRRLDSVLTNPEVSPLIDKNLVVVHVDVLERGEKKVIENPGGDELLRSLGGEESGLPFYAFLDKNGKEIADSNVMPKAQNIGFPGSPEEREAFKRLLAQGAPAMAGQDLSKIMTHFGS